MCLLTNIDNYSNNFTYISVSNYHIVYLKLTQCYINLSQKKLGGNNKFIISKFWLNTFKHSPNKATVKHCWVQSKKNSGGHNFNFNLGSHDTKFYFVQGFFFFFLIYLLLFNYSCPISPPLTPLHPAHPLPPTFPPIVHVHGSYL